MDKDLQALWTIPVKMLMKRSKHKYFFTQEEFERDYALHMEIARLRTRLEEKLKT